MGVLTDDTFKMPGVITEIEADYSKGYDASEFGSTESVLLIGTAFDGPTGILTPVYTPEHGQYIFGKTYDNGKKEEATLSAEIKNAYDAGCRTIYALRINGEVAYKDFDFNIETEMKLRIAGRYGSNITKECYMVLDTSSGDEKVKIYKPASKATIREKMAGEVESDTAVMINEILLNKDLGLTRDSRVTEMIRVINGETSDSDINANNVLKLSIVNSEGLDVTNSIEAQDLRIGALYSGIYFVGRDVSLCDCITEEKYNLVVDDTSAKPYEDFDGLYFRTVDINTDVSLGIPIYAKNIQDMRTILKKVGITNTVKYDFLETAGICDAAFAKNTVDYEKTSLDTFEIYKMLGSGFATTAKAFLRTDSVTGEEITPKIKETPVSDPNRVIAINDGYYSVLEDANITYKVLTCGNYEDVITSKIPRPDDFKIASPSEILILGDYLKVTSVVDSDDFTLAKKFSLNINQATDTSSDKLSDVYADKIVTCVGKITDLSILEADAASEKIPNNTYLMLCTDTVDVDGKITDSVGTLVKVENKKIKELHMSTLEDDLYLCGNIIYYGVLDTVNNKISFKPITVTAADVVNNIGPTYANKEYLLVDNGGKLYVIQMCDPADLTTEGVYFTPLGLFKSMFSGNEDKTNCFATNNFYDINKVNVTSAVLNSTTLEEFAEMLSSEDYLGKLFKFEITEDHLEEKDDYVTDIAAISSALGTSYTLDKNKEITYDYNLYIPYKSTDNFPRQLAQHCTYTESKTCPCKGFIGTKTLLDIGLKSIANKVTNLCSSNNDLYAKKDNGRNILNKDNMPYPLGRNINVPIVQYTVSTLDNYNYVSNGAAGYAGMVSCLPLDQSSTNQPISIPTPTYSFSTYQLKKLTQKGFVTIKNDNLTGIVVTDGITMAPSESSFSRLSISRISGEFERLIRVSCLPFIGQQKNLANLNAMQTAIKSNLDTILDTLIENYTFAIASTNTEDTLTEVEINYTMVPINEIRVVDSTINVKNKL